MDGKVFNTNEWEVGVTVPPFHVFCRGTTIPYFDDDFGLEGKRAAKDKDGKTYYVPADMSYKEWKEKFVVKDLKGVLRNGTLKIKEKTMDLQFFAQKDVPKQNSTSLMRAIKNLTQRIEEYEKYIENPHDYIPEWDEYSTLRQEGLKKHWKKEIRNFNDSINNRIEELKKRGDYNG